MSENAGLRAALPWARRIAAGCAAAWCVGLLVVFALRLTHPLELEWMEGGLLHQASRLQAGEALYPPPSADFIPFLYTPLYAVVLALLGTVFPLDYALARSISIVACLAVGAGIWRAVGREGKGRQEQLMAVGLAASGYIFSFRWLDVGRPDALAMAFSVWGLVLLREAWGDHRKAMLAGLLMACAFWTKQTAAVLILASGVGALVVAPRQLWSYAGAISLLLGGGLAWGNTATDGWLWKYIHELHLSHAFNEERFYRKTWGMFLHAWPWLVPVLGTMLWSFFSPWWGRRRRLDAAHDARWAQYLRARRGLGFWAIIAVAGLLASALGYSTQWAEPNAFIPGVIFLAIFIGVGLPRGELYEGIAVVCVALQLVFSAVLEPFYQPIQDHGWKALGRSYRAMDWERTIPTPQQRQLARQTRALLEEASGSVLALHRPWWSIVAGGRGHVGSMGLHDVDATARAKIQEELRQRLRTQRYAHVWLDGEPPAWMVPGLIGYHVVERRWGDARVRPLSGYMSEAGMVTPYRDAQLRLAPVVPRHPPPGGRALADFEDGTPQGFVLRGGWSQRPARGIFRRAPAVGPIGGEYLLSSAAAGGLRGRGVAVSPSWTMGAGSVLQLWVASGPRPKGLSVAVVNEETGERIALPLRGEAYVLSPVEWTVPPEWGDRPFHLELADRSDAGALWVDDVWSVPAEG